MSYYYSGTSLNRLETCDHRLYAIFVLAIKKMDIAIVCGHRNAEDQNTAFKSNNSKVQWPDSKHNDSPSKAIDAVPYPHMWDSRERFYWMAGIIEGIAQDLNIKLRWGGNWDMDNNFDDQYFMDLGHWELVD